ncbi:MAG: nicotinate phosphoribosyltransferase [Deltaproteobacteria bacterium]|nr:nicotinate phosphoribosyltransferase [Deltaproteobacteria bacterium]
MIPSDSPLLTDLYQLTMLQTYLDAGMSGEAVFEFYVRRLPPTRGFLVACGLESVLDFLTAFHFSPDDIRQLSQTGRFSGKLLDYLASCSFKGDVHALPEGTIFFADEPVLRITAPIPIAQIVETRIINLLNFEVSVASKAARCLLAARGLASLVDFGLRRAHGAEAGMLAARAACAMGFAGTSNVLAGVHYGLPVSGTMAHSYIEAVGDEEEAFLAFARSNRSNVTFLIDTYDTLNGAHHAARAALTLAAEGIATSAVRLDSGDLLALSFGVRRILNDYGLAKVKILASGNLDEYGIDRLMAAGAPIDGFGIGTKLDTVEDAPYLECAYKLAQYAGRPTMKYSSGKQTMPGAKQVFRRFQSGVMTGDTVALADSTEEGVPLLEHVMKEGRRLSAPPSLASIASRTKDQLRTLPLNLRGLAETAPYPVAFDPGLRRLREAAQTLIDARRKL